MDANIARVYQSMRPVLESVKQMGAQVLEEGLAIIEAVSDSLVRAAKAMRQVNDNAPAISAGFAKRLASIGFGIAGMGVLVAIGGGLVIKNLNTFTVGLETIAQITEQLIDSARAMRQIDDHVPRITDGFAEKLASMGVALVGMGALVAIGGYVKMKNPDLLTEGLVVTANITEQLVETAKAMKTIDENVPKISDGFGEKLASMGVALVSMGALVALGGYLGMKNPDLLLTGLIVVADITEQLVETARAMQKIDDHVPKISDGFGERLASMGVALGGMGALVAVAGVLDQKKPGVLIAGLTAVSMITESLIEAAKAVELIDEKVPSISDGFAAKLATVGAALIGMGAFITLMGAAALKTGGMLLVAQGLGMMITLGLAATIVQAARAIGEIVEHVPNNLGLVEGKIEIIGQALKAVASQNLTGGIGLIRNFIGMFDVAILAATTMLYAEIGKTLEEIQQLDINPDVVMERVEAIGETLQAVAGHNIQRGLNILGNLLGAIDVAILGATVMLYAEIGKQIQKINDLDFCPDRVMEKVDLISEVIEAVRSDRVAAEINLLSAFLEAVEIAIIGKVINTYGEIAETLQKLSEMDFTDEDRASAMETIELLQDFISDLEIGSSSLGERIGRWLRNAPDNTDTEAAREHIQILYDIAQALNGINQITLEKSQINERLDTLKEIIDDLEITGFALENAEELNLGPSVANIQKLVDLVTALAEIPEVNRAVVTQSIVDVKEIIAEIEELGIENFQIDGVRNILRNTAEIITDFGTIINTIAGIPEFDKEQVMESIRNVKAVMKALNNQGENAVDLSKFQLENMPDIEETVSFIDRFASLINSLYSIPDLDSGPIKTSIENAKEVLEKITYFGAEAFRVEGEGDLLEATNQIISDFTAIINSVASIPEFDKTQAMKTMEEVKAVMQALNGEGDIDLCAFELNEIPNIEETVEFISSFASLINSLYSIPELDSGPIEASITAASEVLIEIQEFIAEAPDLTGLEAIKETITRLAEVFNELSSIKTQFAEIDIVGQLATSMEAALPRAETAVTNISTTIKEAFATELAGFDRMGQNVMDGLNQGMESRRQTLINTATSIANAMTAAIQRALDINSPSRVMRDQVGRFIPEGIAVGIDGEADVVTKSLTSLADGMLQTMGADLLSDYEIKSLKSGTRREVTVNYQQLVPQINVEVNTDGGDVDVEALVEQIEDMILEKQDALLIA